MKKILITFAVLFIAISAFAQIAGSTYENPITVTLPLSGYTGDTSLYGDDYESGWVDPSFSYLGGDDMVLEFTLAETSYLSGTLASTDGGTWIGMCVVNQAPDPINAAPTFARASSSSGNTATLDATVVPAGTYALIIGTWPSPQSFQFTLDLTASAVPTEPELAVDPTVWDFGELAVGNTASKQFTLTNIGGGSLEISSVVVSGNNFSLTEAFTPISLGIQESDTFTVEYAPTVAGTHAGTITISDNRATTVINLSGTATDPTITSFPWTEGFESVTTPALPTHWSVTEGSTGASRHWATTSSDSHGASAANSGDNFAYLYCYLASTTYNPYSLITPPIALDATEKRLSYYYWIGDNTYAEPLFVDVSTDLSNWTTLYTHDTSNTLAWFNNTVSLSAYASSTVYLRFRGVSNYGSGLCDFGIDDVVVEDIPDDPIFSYTPESIDFGGHRVNDPTDYTNVMISNTGGGTLSLAAGDISLIGTDSNQFDFTTTTGFPANLTAGQSVTVPVRFAPTSVGNKNATLRINYGGDNYDVALSGNAVSEAALLESFEDSVPPPGWASIGVYNWSRSTTRSVHGDASAYRSGSTSNQYILSTPMLDIEAGSSLDFWAAGSNTTSGLEILYSTDRENWTQIGDTIVHPGSYTFVNYNYDLGSLAGNSYYLGFRTTLVSGSSYLDYVVGPDITPALPGAPILDEPGDLDIDVNEYTTFEWDAPNTGGIPIHYNLYLDTVDGSTLFTSEVMSPYTPANPLAYETTYYWTVEAVNDAGTGPQAAVQSFTTRANPIVSTFPWTEDFGTTSS
ncbi:MAG: choice-of-anchor D domain-containing protein, partial [Candidatus Cloacimonadaceae bacterium]